MNIYQCVKTLVLLNRIIGDEKMNERKICFIYCVNDSELFNESAKYVEALNIPEGFEIEIITIKDANSMAAGYNSGIQKTDAKYKVYIHQDTFIIHKDFICDVINILKKNSNLGMLGVVGAKVIPDNGVWWDSNEKYGSIYDSHTGSMKEYQFNTPIKDYECVQAIDGLIMVTQYDLRWREELFKGWHFYDASQSVEFLRAGYEVGVVKQETPWIIHDSGIPVLNNGYDYYRDFFVRHYAQFLELAQIKTMKPLMEAFHSHYYNSYVWTTTSWLGTDAWKCPLDLWIYQEILSDIKPDIIIECGTAHGGSALFLASICDLLNNGRVITVDIEIKENRPQHDRITYLHGSSTSDAIINQIGSLIKDEDVVMVILDSDHSKAHVLEELKTYNRFVTKGSYMIVEDSNINGHPVAPEFGPGPMEAIDEFFSVNDNYIIDKSKEKFFLTFNPRGYLRKIK